MYIFNLTAQDGHTELFHRRGYFGLWVILFASQFHLCETRNWCASEDFLGVSNLGTKTELKLAEGKASV